MSQPDTQIVSMIEDSRRFLLASLAGARDITFIRASGNIGDELIYAGTRQLLAGVNYREISIHDVESVTGHTALVSGSGDWCRVFHNLTPTKLPLIEKRFEHVVILPTTFETSVELVRETLSKTQARVFARERESYTQILGLCNAALAHDTAFFFDFRPYQHDGDGLLLAFRTDRESALPGVPVDNHDISLTSASLDEFLWTIACHRVIATDRAHVMIAAALLGKHVEYFPSSYFKVDALAEYGLPGLSVHRNTLSAEERGAKRISLTMPGGVALEFPLVAADLAQSPEVRVRSASYNTTITEQKAWIEEQEEAITGYKAWIAQKDAVIAEQKVWIEQQEVAIVGFNEWIAQKDAVITEQKAWIEEQEEAITGYKAWIAQKDAVIAEQKARLGRTMAARFRVWIHSLLPRSH